MPDKVVLNRTPDESRASSVLLAPASHAFTPKPKFGDDMNARFHARGWDGLLPEEKRWAEQEFEASWGRPMRGLNGKPDPNHM